MLPDRKWKLREGKYHTTVFSEETNEVFDIIFWGIDQRLEEYELSKLSKTQLIYSCEDKSLGGNQAYLMSE